jgi:hypothetical protein
VRQKLCLSYIFSIRTTKYFPLPFFIKIIEKIFTLHRRTTSKNFLFKMHKKTKNLLCVGAQQTYFSMRIAS